MGLEHFRHYIYGKPIELMTDHQALEPSIKTNRSRKSYSAGLTRWLDRLAHFDIQIKHVAGKHLSLTDDLSRNPIARPRPIENYEEEYVINSKHPYCSSSTLTAASPMKENQGREVTKKQIPTKQTTNQKRDTCRNYKRVTTNETTAVRCYQPKVQCRNYKRVTTNETTAVRCYQPKVQYAF